MNMFFGEQSILKSIPITSKEIRIIILTLIFSCVVTHSAFAHRVTIFAWVEDDMIYTESKFNGGKKVINGVVEVFDASGTKLVQGKTDANGEFAFKVPRKTEMKIILMAGMGHSAEWRIPLEELAAPGEEAGEVLPAPEVSSALSGAAQPTGISRYESVVVAGENTQAQPRIMPDEIQEAVEKALEKKLKPVITMLNKSLNPDKAPDLSDIFGGMGYIFGLVGVGAYFNYRRKKSDDLRP